MSRYRLPILAGFLIGTSYIPFPPWAIFFCQVPLLLFWFRDARSAKQAFFAGWITQFLLNLIGFHWIAYTTVEFGHFPLIGGLVVLMGFAAMAHLHYALTGLIGYWLNRKFRVPAPYSIFVYTLTFAICELFYPMIFPWHLGYPWLWAGLPGAQFADVIGFEGLNVATLLANAALAWAVAEGLFRYTGRSRKPWLIASSAVALIALLNLLGLGRDHEWRTTDAELNVAAVQGNIGNFDKYMAESRTEFGVPIVDKFLKLSDAALKAYPEANLMIWPETAFPSYMDRQFLGQPLQARVRQFLMDHHMPLLTGSYSSDRGARDTFNALFYLDANGELGAKPYRKSILLVFGETFPFSDYIPYMEKFFPEQGSFARGPGPTVLNLRLNGGPAGLAPTTRPETVSVGAQICYEGLYPWFSAGLAQQGAQIFVNVTNDSWFWKPFEPNQHLYMTLARAIEFRRPLLRSTNTGITTAVLASGEILEKSPIGEEWTGLFKIPYLKNPPHTIYEKLVSFWPAILLAALVLVLVIGNRISVGSGRERANESSKN